MVYTARVVEGMVVLEDGVHLPEGAEIRVQVDEVLAERERRRRMLDETLDYVDSIGLTFPPGWEFDREQANER